MRRKTNILSLDTDSALALMQEIYNDVVEQKSIASLITKKMLSFMKEAEDMSVLGPVIKEQQKIINECVEKKLSLSKLQSGIWEKTNSSKESFTLSDLDVDDEVIKSLMEKDLSKMDESYKMKK